MSPSKTIHKVLNFKKPCSFLSLLKISIHHSKIRAKWNLSPPKSHPVHLRASVSLPESPALYPNPEDQPTRGTRPPGVHMFMTTQQSLRRGNKELHSQRQNYHYKSSPLRNSKVASSELQNKLQCLWTYSSFLQFN